MTPPVFTPYFLLLVPILFGIWLIIRGIRGRLLLSAPRCRKCGQDLRRADDAWDKCPECGVDLGDGRSVVFGRAQRRPKLIVIGSLVTLLGPLITIVGVRGLIALTQRRTPATIAGPMGATPSALRGGTNEAVLATLATNWDEPWVWQEIDTRHKDGRLEDAAITAALEDMVAAAESSQSPTDGLAWGRDHLVRWRVAGIVGDDLNDRLRMVRISPHLWMPYRVRKDEVVDFTVANASLVPALIAVERIRIDGHGDLEISYTEARGRRAGPPGVGGPGKALRGTCAVALEPGEYELFVDLEVGLLEAVDAAAFSVTPVPARADWSENMITARRTLQRTITVVADEVALVETVVRESQRASVRAILEPEAAVAQVNSGRVTINLVMPNETVAPPVGLAFRATVVVGDRSWQVATMSMVGTGRSRSGGGSQISADEFDRSIETVKVVFEPYFDKVRTHEQQAGRQYWGDAIVFEDVPVRWY